MRATSKWLFVPRFPSGNPKILKLGTPATLGPITLFANLWLRWSLKQSCSSHQELSNSMWHTTYMQGNLVDFWLLVVGSQIGNLTPSLSFGHNLCFRCPNGSCEPISNIYVLKAFYSHKEILNLMSFDPYNHSLKIRKSTGTLTPKVKVPLGVWGFILSHSFALPGTWNVTPRLPLGSHSCKPFALVASPRLGL
jgi:hypothetical protein